MDSHANYWTELEDGIDNNGNGLIDVGEGGVEQQIFRHEQFQKNNSTNVEIFNAKIIW